MINRSEQRRWAQMINKALDEMGSPPDALELAERLGDQIQQYNNGVNPKAYKKLLDEGTFYD